MSPLFPLCTVLLRVWSVHCPVPKFLQVVFGYADDGSFYWHGRSVVLNANFYSLRGHSVAYEGLEWEYILCSSRSLITKASRIQLLIFHLKWGQSKFAFCFDKWLYYCVYPQVLDRKAFNRFMIVCFEGWIRVLPCIKIVWTTRGKVQVCGESWKGKEDACYENSSRRWVERRGMAFGSWDERRRQKCAGGASQETFNFRWVRRRQCRWFTQATLDR